MDIDFSAHHVEEVSALYRTMANRELRQIEERSREQDSAPHQNVADIGSTRRFKPQIGTKNP